ncbi:MAG: hypothetical protein GQ540_03925 [Lutibacter sp.]|uniref:hypothetical protein n=1 Tax=Lutibacter sp. TaxID=1925666 RepID=UPI0019E7FCD8|nr:hypothetical protein [Lutibacter sp.]NOR27662.1 hypothetical protein [Lutibacter sp.]
MNGEESTLFIFILFIITLIIAVNIKINNIDKTNIDKTNYARDNMERFVDPIYPGIKIIGLSCGESGNIFNYDSCTASLKDGNNWLTITADCGKKIVDECTIDN